MKNKDFTPVIFRKFKTGLRSCNEEVIAIFPTLPGDSSTDTCQSYQRVGQHGACSIDFTAFTVPAKPEEYTGLLEELKSIGYNNLKVYQHAMQWMFEKKCRISRLW